MKKITVIVIALFLAVNAFAEELTYKVIQDTPSWSVGEYIVDESSISGTIKAGAEVLLEIGSYDYFMQTRDGIIVYEKPFVSYNVTEISTNTKYMIEESNIIPANTQDLFDTSFLTEIHRPSKFLIKEHFVSVLQSGFRDKARQYEKEFIADVGEGNEYDPAWWEEGLPFKSTIRQNIISLPYAYYAFVKNIEKIDNGYKVDSFSWWEEKESILYFQFDGDYIDVCEDSLENKIFSLVYVSPEFYEGVKTVIKEDKPVDLTNMIWPRRADGSSDYDDKIMERQEIPERIIDPLEDTYLLIDENTTVAQLEEAKRKLGEEGFRKVVNNLDSNVQSAFQKAIKNNQKIDVIQYLLDSVGKDDPLLLLYAEKSRKEVVSLLLNAGFSFTVRDNREGTPNRGATVFEIAEYYNEPSYEIFLPLKTMGWQEGVDKIIWQELGSVYKTTDKLRLRSSEGTSGEALLTLANNTAVRVREIGTLEKIDGLIAFWLQVEVAEDSTDTEGNAVAKGTTGWLFGGYVSMEKEAGYEIQIAEEEPMFGEQESENEETKETEPFFPLIPIIAVVGVLVLCAIIVVVKTKKNSTT